MQCRLFQLTEPIQDGLKADNNACTGDTVWRACPSSGERWDGVIYQDFTRAFERVGSTVSEDLHVAL